MENVNSKNKKGSGLHDATLAEFLEKTREIKDDPNALMLFNLEQMDEDEREERLKTTDELGVPEVRELWEEYQEFKEKGE